MFNTEMAFPLISVSLHTYSSLADKRIISFNDSLMPLMSFSFNPYPADHDYCRFLSVLLVGQITVIGNEMCV